MRVPDPVPAVPRVATGAEDRLRRQSCSPPRAAPPPPRSLWALRVSHGRRLCALQARVHVRSSRRALTTPACSQVSHHVSPRLELKLGMVYGGSRSPASLPGESPWAWVPWAPPFLSLTPVNHPTTYPANTAQILLTSFRKVDECKRPVETVC